MCIDRTNMIPFLATSKAAIEFIGKYNARDKRETDMMCARWRTFQFSYQIPREHIKNLELCPHCFSELVLLGCEVDLVVNV